jgi:ComF family protein
LFLSDSIGAIAHLFYPSICFGCRKNEISPTEWLCLNCLSTLPLTGFENTRDNPVEQLFWGRTPIQFASSCFFYVEKTPIQRLIHEVKYKEQQQLGRWLGQMMGRRLANIFHASKVDLLLPMPLHPKKQKHRGYNQATLLCEGIHAITNCNFLEQVLIRNTNTKTQTKKSRIERWENVSEVFDITINENVINKHIVLVDDVITTGASTEACAATLIKKGASAVSICSLAFTL